MKTQIEQIKQARRAYVLPLNQTGTQTARFAIYLDAGRGLNVLWPVADGDRDKRVLLPLQVYSTLKQYPAYHFVLKGIGFNRLGEIREMLQAINPGIEVGMLMGGQVSDTGY